ncbi:MAG: glycosyltransferase family 2 protein [Actinomycetota bacterium]|nr:glycosyltransferase family 2 protein [Actinomycetota bacterium]
MSERRPAVIVPTYDGASVLSRLLTSLRSQTWEHDVIVVDNGSRDSTPQLLAHEFPEVRTVWLEENVGFARAVNRGVRASDARTIVLVNNDVACEPEFIEELCRALAPPEVVMVAGILLQADDPAKIDTAGVRFDETLLAFDHLYGEDVALLDDDPAPPLGPTGGAAAFDRRAFDDVGGFDENFFAYLEDVDLIARLISAGARCRLAVDARGIHHHSATLGSGSTRKNELMGWSRGYTLAKYRLHCRPRLFARAAVAEAAVTAGQLVVDRTASGVKGRVAGFRAGLRVPAERPPPLPDDVRGMPLRELLTRRAARRRRR